MQDRTNNPLAGYFRQPAIYLKIPSLGRWWTPGTIDLPENQQIPVYPMTARDEIAIRTPDALLNGQGVVDVIQSCCPNIKDAWSLPAVDTDAILISIRIATYGTDMDVDSTCPHCNEKNQHVINLGDTLGELTCPDFNNLVNFRDLKIRLKPQSYRDVNKNNMINFEEQKLLQALENSNLTDEQKLAQISANMKRIADIGMNNLVTSTDYVELPNGIRVDDESFIKEFYENAENELVAEMQKILAETLNEHKIKPVKLKCGNCSSDYESNINFDFSNFFAKGF
jgi:predicted metal-dependent hydrolase